MKLVSEKPEKVNVTICALLISTWFFVHRPLCCRQSPARSEHAETCVLEDLNATLAYAVQIQCVTSSDCSQCVWSRVYSVSPGEVALEASRGAICRAFLCVRYRVTISFSELTVKPVVVDVNETDFGGTSGRRLLTLTWEVLFPYV